MVKPLVQFRLSDDEMELLRSVCNEGESEGLAAKRLILQVLGVTEKSSTITPLQLTDDLKNYINEEVEQKTQCAVNSTTAALERLQKYMKQLEIKIVELEKPREVKRGRPKKDDSNKPKGWEAKVDEQLDKALGD